MRPKQSIRLGFEHATDGYQQSYRFTYHAVFSVMPVFVCKVVHLGMATESKTRFIKSHNLAFPDSVYQDAPMTRP